jgi:DNA transformation protein
MTEITQLNGLGPKSQEMLASAGITREAELRKLGSVEAYVRVKRAIPGVSLNLLWAIEAALTGATWQQVARKDRTRLLLALDDREKMP